MHDNLVDKFLTMPLPEASVSFKSSDPELDRLYAKAEKLAAANRVEFAPGIPALIEGGGYSRVYTETQPMGGEMYAKRDLRAALNNQLLFMLCQRADGRLPGAVISVANTTGQDWRNDPAYKWSSLEWLEHGLVADYGQLQGNALPEPAFDLYFLLDKPRRYLELLAAGIEAFDAYLWRTRDPFGEGVLQTWCEWDTGEDNCSRFGASPTRWPHDYPPSGEHAPDPANPEHRRDYYLWSHVPATASKADVKVPIRSMDVMAYSYANRNVRALIAAELGDGTAAALWRERAEAVRNGLIRHLWCPEKGAAYDRDRDNRVMDTLIHNNLRCMWYGIFTQAMADEFVRRHLLNPAEFWTPVPLPSIAANDPLFRNVADNNWSGQSEGLTWQRAIRALANYGYYAEVTTLGRKFIGLAKATGLLLQQYDPFDAAKLSGNTHRNGYGPSVLAFLEYVSRTVGVHVQREQVFWSGLTDAGAVEYTQRFGDCCYTLTNDGKTFTGTVNDRECFACSAGVRVVTDRAGNPVQIVGIDDVPHRVQFRTPAGNRAVDVPPNGVLNSQGVCP